MRMTWCEGESCKVAESRVDRSLENMKKKMPEKRKSASVASSMESFFDFLHEYSHKLAFFDE